MYIYIYICLSISYISIHIEVVACWQDYSSVIKALTEPIDFFFNQFDKEKIRLAGLDNKTFIGI